KFPPPWRSQNENLLRRVNYFLLSPALNFTLKTYLLPKINPSFYSTHTSLRFSTRSKNSSPPSEAEPLLHDSRSAQFVSEPVSMPSAPTVKEATCDYECDPYFVKRCQGQSLRRHTNDYEKSRMLRIQENQKKLQALGVKNIDKSLTSLTESDKTKKNKKK
ncbi:hypothetical protein M8C21_026434, partial [Ambrosia artemisiifolia]